MSDTPETAKTEFIAGIAEAVDAFQTGKFRQT
jgi:hypothetical protein